MSEHRHTGTQANDRQARHRRALEVVGGLAVIAAGFGLLVSLLGWIDVSPSALIARLWPALIVAVGVGLLIEREWFEGIAVSGIGLALLGSANDLVPGLTVGVVVAALVIAHGLSMLGRALRRK